MGELKTVQVHTNGRATYEIDGFRFGPVRTLDNYARGSGHLIVLDKAELQDIINGHASIQRAGSHPEPFPDLSKLEM